MEDSKKFRFLFLVIFLLTSQMLHPKLVASDSFFSSNPPSFLRTSQQKNLIFIEPLPAAYSMVRRAKANGHNVILLTYNLRDRTLPDRILRLADWNVQVDTIDSEAVKDKILEISSQIRVDGIIPTNDNYVPIAAIAASSLGTPKISIEAAYRTRYKDVMRQTLKENSIRIPNVFVYTTSTPWSEFQEFLDCVSFPLVVKPVACSSSYNVRRVNNLNQLHDAMQNIFSRTELWGVPLQTDKMLIEEYIDGKEFSVEGFIQDGQSHVLSITEKLVADQVSFIEVGHISNPPITTDLGEKIKTYVEDVIRAMEMDNTPFHAELRLNRFNEPVLMEIAARLCGDRIAEIINYTTGVNYYDLILKILTGEEIHFQKLVHGQYAGVVFFHRNNLAKLQKINNLETLTSNPNVREFLFYYKLGEVIPHWHYYDDKTIRLGHAILTNENYEELKKQMELSDINLSFE